MSFATLAASSGVSSSALTASCKTWRSPVHATLISKTSKVHLPKKEPGVPDGCPDNKSLATNDHHLCTNKCWFHMTTALRKVGNNSLDHISLFVGTSSRACRINVS